MSDDTRPKYRVEWTTDADRKRKLLTVRSAGPFDSRVAAEDFVIALARGVGATLGDTRIRVEVKL